MHNSVTKTFSYTPSEHPAIAAFFEQHSAGRVRSGIIRKALIEYLERPRLLQLMVEQLAVIQQTLDMLVQVLVETDAGTAVVLSYPDKFTLTEE